MEVGGVGLGVIALGFGVLGARFWFLILGFRVQGLEFRIVDHNMMSQSLVPALEATQGQIDGFFSRILYICHLEKVAYVGD